MNLEDPFIPAAPIMASRHRGRVLLDGFECLRGLPFTCDKQSTGGLRRCWGRVDALLVGWLEQRNHLLVGFAWFDRQPCFRVMVPDGSPVIPVICSGLHSAMGSESFLSRPNNSDGPSC